MCGVSCAGLDWYMGECGTLVICSVQIGFDGFLYALYPAILLFCILHHHQIGTIQSNKFKGSWENLEGSISLWRKGEGGKSTIGVFDPGSN